MPSSTAAGSSSSKGRPHSAVPLEATAVKAPTATPWPCPADHVLPFTQIFAHIASTSIMVLLVLFSFVEDVSKYLHSLISPPAPTTAATTTPATIRKSPQSAATRTALLKQRRPAAAGGRKDLSDEEGGSSTAINDSSDDREEDGETTDMDDPLSTPEPEPAAPVLKKKPSMLSAFIPSSLRFSRRVDEPSKDEALFYSTRRTTMDVRDYCAHAGYSCDTFETITEDGFILFIHRVGSHDRAPAPKGPVILMHGLFQSSGVWVTNGLHSLAFYLVDQGFDVWMGNNRTCIEQHIRLSPSDAAFWNWSLDELARYDFPATLDLVRRETGYDKVAFVGHSQGNAQAFLSMLQNPAVGNKLSLFVALAPAVYIGSLLETFPVCLLMECPAELYRVLFGVKAFLPVMTLVQKIFPPYVFATLAYHMFHYLFGWTDTNWDPRNKSCYFQFTPRPQSSKAIHHWAQMGSAGVIKPFEPNPTPKPSLPAAARKANANFDVSSIRCPLAMYYGSKDTIIDGPALHKKCLDGGVDLVYAEVVDGYEHMDCLWSMDAKERVWKSMVKLLERAGKKRV
ncbi:hypothetical protein HDU96_001049 [Phlyctochytrium bullatum]|nr:hypothetical protein HDU96_001049 [Phlyctochytrium bullatum]